MKKIFFCLFLVASLFLLKRNSVYADQDFATSCNATYSVNESGNTHVVYAFTIKNTKPSYYASSYTLHTGFTRIDNLTASDPGGVIVPAVKKTDHGTDMTMYFNQKITGTGKSLPFTISFDTPNVAQKVGNIWEVTIPGITNQETFENFNVHIEVPASFGKPTYVKPEQISITNSLDFTKEQLNHAGIAIGYGHEQAFNFLLTYHLQNTTLFPVETEIALPPNTNYQTSYISDINPQPKNVHLDKDGNWLALFSLLPSQKMDIVVHGKMLTSIFPKTQSLSSEETTVYTHPQKYWESNNQQIKKLAASLKTPYDIYQYVTSHLTYDFTRVTNQQERLGAVKTLDSPTSAVCLEFTDLFIALVRAAGIPAREVDGYAYAQNSKEKPLSLVKDILHAWPEYYDLAVKQWVMVDPTWENTTKGTDYFHTFDFDHFAFIVKGVSSTYPIPAGGYKLQGQNNIKDVQVYFGDSSVDMTPKLSVSATLPSTALSNTQINGSIIIHNLGHTLLHTQPITVESTGIYTNTKTIPAGEIPPFGFLTLPITFYQPDFLTSKTATVTFHVAGQTIHKSVIILPSLSKYIVYIGGGIIVILAIFILIITAATRRLRISR